MNESERTHDALEALLRASAPEPLLDDGFVARTMAAVDQAAHALPAQRRAAPVAPIAASAHSGYHCCGAGAAIVTLPSGDITTAATSSTKPATTPATAQRHSRACAS